LAGVCLAAVNSTQSLWVSFDVFSVNEIIEAS